MKIKISATFEGKCDICKKEKLVFTAGDEDSKKIVSVCKDCTEGMSDMKTSDVIEKYGKDDGEAFKAEGINIKGLDEMKSELRKRKT